MTDIPAKYAPHATLPPSIADLGELARQTARDQLIQAFDEQGMTHALMAEVGADLLQATKVTVQYDKGTPDKYDKEGNLVEAGREAGFVYSKPLSDNNTRHNTLKLLMDFHDVMPSKRVDINDKRQTRELASAIFERLEQAGRLGAGDKSGVLPAPAPGEVALMGEMIRVGREKAERTRAGVSLNPLHMESTDD